MDKPKYKKGVTASSFDLMHAGHVLMLKEAKEICEHLTVCLQKTIEPKDQQYRLKEKGQVKKGFIMSLEERRILLEGSKYVDDIIEYSTEDEWYQILKNGDFDVRIIGEDWRGRKYTGHDLPIEVYFNSRDHEYSTTRLKKLVYEAEEERRASS